MQTPIRVKTEISNMLYYNALCASFLYRLCPYCAVSLLGCRRLPGKEDELRAIFLQPLDVGLQGFSRLVPAPGIHRDTNCLGKFLVDTSHLGRVMWTQDLNLGKSELLLLLLLGRQDSHQLEKGSKHHHHGADRYLGVSPLDCKVLTTNGLLEVRESLARFCLVYQIL